MSKTKNTSQQYDDVVSQARSIFIKKAKDYGTSWRILRPSSLTDQLFIKASRIRSIEENKDVKKIDEPVEDEYIGIINYSLMALIQLGEKDKGLELSIEEVKTFYDKYIISTKSLMEAKNHDYGEAWRDMRVSSMTDLILMKLLRVKSIENNDGKTIISEGLDANFQDIINYAIFAMIKLSEQE